jgi:hypothetical protein
VGVGIRNLVDDFFTGGLLSGGAIALVSAMWCAVLCADQQRNNDSLVLAIPGIPPTATRCSRW